MLAPLVVLLEIDVAGFTFFEFEGDAPGPVDVDRVAFRVEPVQGMKVEARNVHFLGPGSEVKTI
jgi:hypothetical protein